MGGQCLLLQTRVTNNEGVNIRDSKFRDARVATHGNNENWHPTKTTRYTVPGRSTTVQRFSPAPT